jgi:hypothetical protein
MKEGAEREAALTVAVRQAEEWRGRFLREKSDLEKRLAAALAANPPAAAPSASTPPPAVAKNLARLETRVRDLEKERASLAKKVEELTKASQQGLAVTRGWRMVSPRERTEEFHRLRR